MSDKEHYNINLNIAHGFSELIDVNKINAECKEKWFNQTLCRVNDCVVRIGIVQGEFHWHKHDHEDEFFQVVEGKLLLDIEDKTHELEVGHCMAVKKGVMHRTRARERVVMLMIGGTEIQPEGD